MPRECTVCTHPESFAINEALVLEGASNRAMTRQYGLSKDAVRRHREHIPEMLAKASQAEEIANADTLLDRLEGLHKRTEAVLEEVEETDLYGVRLATIRELRRNLEVIGEVTKELHRQPTVNLEINAEWLEIKAVVLGALGEHPLARKAVLEAMEARDNGHVR